MRIIHLVLRAVLWLLIALYSTDIYFYNFPFVFVSVLHGKSKPGKYEKGATAFWLRKQREEGEMWKLVSFSSDICPAQTAQMAILSSPAIPFYMKCLQTQPALHLTLHHVEVSKCGLAPLATIGGQFDRVRQYNDNSILQMQPHQNPTTLDNAAGNVLAHPAVHSGFAARRNSDV